MPTEAEWEKAAGWDPRTAHMRVYPWGDQPPDDNLAPKEKIANYNNVDLDTTKMGSYPQDISPVGAYDMAGNVWEWIFDWYGPYDLSQQFNPVGSPSSEYKVVKGGSWSNKTLATYLRVANRGMDYPYKATNETGFRCVLED